MRGATLPADLISARLIKTSFWSSVLRLPWTMVSQDCIEDCQELSSDGNDGEFFRLTVGDEPRKALSV